VWWYITVIPALGRLRQEDHEFEELGYQLRSCLHKDKTRKKQNSKHKILISIFI
jgi:hypothetical protein